MIIFQWYCSMLFFNAILQWDFFNGIFSMLCFFLSMRLLQRYFSMVISIFQCYSHCHFSMLFFRCFFCNVIFCIFSIQCYFSRIFFSMLFFNVIFSKLFLQCYFCNINFSKNLRYFSMLFFSRLFSRLFFQGYFFQRYFSSASL